MLNPKALPPLKSLSVFAIASKSSNFSEAAIKLSLTQSAVSHQIINLENFLGCKLFIRSANKTELTEQGEQLAIAVNQGLSLIENAVSTIQGTVDPCIHFGVYSAFAIHRLTPALNELLAKTPELDLRLKMLQRGEPETGLGLDIILSDKPVNDLAYQCICLKKERYFPVFSTALCPQGATLSSLLQDDSIKLIDLPSGGSWKKWQEEQNVTFPQKQQQEFSHSILILKAALAGQGIALLGESLIEPELANQQLIKLSDKYVSFPQDGYYFSYHKKRAKDANITLIRHWLMSLLSV
ncbi:LysR family transcriptional regulator [Thalassotalea insulae]|uniref:LysR family transcriptional regulator n=1 Tax=Thalassotalea insulae TaxID=2056778 RepID=A0ABQ6GMH6_9GAMM|nr:LysR family transcriptional regulator [Thalassotalea insulae]GLX77066.1 LysR family transcriptional regulator [Thalassotalea insulae]